MGDDGRGPARVNMEGGFKQHPPSLLFNVSECFSGTLYPPNVLVACGRSIFGQKWRRQRRV